MLRRLSKSLFGAVVVVSMITTSGVADVAPPRGLHAWLPKHTQSITDDSLAMAADLDRLPPRLDEAGHASLSLYMNAQIKLRLLSQATLMRGDGEMALRVRSSTDIEFLQSPREALERAKSGEAVLVGFDDQSHLGAIVKLKSVPDAYLFVTRYIDP